MRHAAYHETKQQREASPPRRAHLSVAALPEADLTLFPTEEPYQPAEPVPSGRPIDADAQRPWRLADFEALALAQNPAIAEAAAVVRSRRGRALQAGLPPNPSVGYTASEVGNDGNAGQQGALVGQRFVTGGKLRLSRAVAAREIVEAQQHYQAVRQRVLSDVRIAFYDLLIAQQRLEVAKRLYHVSQQGVATVEALRKAQEASGADLLQAKIEANSAQMLIDTSLADREGAWRKLAALIGMPNLPRMDVEGDVTHDLPEIDYEAARDRLLRESPALAAAYVNVARARVAVERARAQAVPDVNVQGSVQYDDASQFTIAGVQVALPLPVVNRNQGGVVEAVGQLAAAQQSMNRLELAVQKRLAEVYRRYQVAARQARRYQQEIVPLAEDTLRLTAEGYQAGEFSYLQLLTVQRTYFQTNLSYLDALGRLWAASRELEGLLLTGSLETAISEGL